MDFRKAMGWTLHFSVVVSVGAAACKQRVGSSAVKDETAADGGAPKANALALAPECAATAEETPGDSYFLTLFSTEAPELATTRFSIFNQTPWLTLSHRSHTWAAFTQVHAGGAMRHVSINWIPTKTHEDPAGYFCVDGSVGRDGKIEACGPEWAEGDTRSYLPTLQHVADVNREGEKPAYRLVRWGPMPVKYALFDFAVSQVKRLKGCDSVAGKKSVEYRAINTGERLSYANKPWTDDLLQRPRHINCFQAVADADLSQPVVHFLTAHGTAATKIVYERFLAAGQILDANATPDLAAAVPLVEADLGLTNLGGTWAPSKSFGTQPVFEFTATK